MSKENKKKAMFALLVFIMATLEIVFGQKNCWTQIQGHLAVLLSKIQLEIYSTLILPRIRECFTILEPLWAGIFSAIGQFNMVTTTSHNHSMKILMGLEKRTCI